MNKSSTLVIGIPLFVIAIILVGVFALRTMTQKTPEVTQLPTSVVPTLKGEVGKPKSGFSETQMTSGIGDLSADLRSVEDDGGASDFSALEAEAAKL